ncbi:hypothetical protein HAX54_040605 [Datura stramonium]|uniref:Uncharacterized protein n=1 Tax=Datura stramonium TaxID=4076 RepID=A0ABS8VSQ4_DATST|nr:hypothetical protein [Datura stramonium]
MGKKRASSSASRLKAPIRLGSGYGSTPGGSRARVHQTKAQTRAHANPQPEVVNGSQHRVVALDYEIVECVRGIGA